MRGRLSVSHSAKLLAMKAADKLSMFLMMNKLMGSDLLEWDWYRSEDLNPNWLPMMNHSVNVDSRLPGKHGIACTMRYSAISIVTDYWQIGMDSQRLTSRKRTLRTGAESPVLITAGSDWLLSMFFWSQLWDTVLLRQPWYTCTRGCVLWVNMLRRQPWLGSYPLGKHPRLVGYCLTLLWGWNQWDKITVLSQMA